MTASNVQEDRASWHIDLRVLVKLLCEGAALIREVVHCLLAVILRRMLEGTFHSRQMIQSRLHPRVRKLLPKQRRGQDSQRTEGDNIAIGFQKCELAAEIDWTEGVYPD